MHRPLLASEQASARGRSSPWSRSPECRGHYGESLACAVHPLRLSGALGPRTEPMSHLFQVTVVRHAVSAGLTSAGRTIEFGAKRFYLANG